MAKTEKKVRAGGKAKGDIYYGDVAKDYEKRRRKQDWWHVEHEQMRQLLEKLPDNLSVVDIPFGTGRFVPLYRAKNFSISGLDASHHMIATAKEILGSDFDGIDTHVGNAANLPYADNAFDLVVSTRFLSDIVVFQEAKKALAEFSRVTRKYGVIQLGHHRGEGYIPAEDSPMGGLASEADVIDLLASNQLRVLEKRLILEKPQDNADIYHFLCEKF